MSQPTETDNSHDGVYLADLVGTLKRYRYFLVISTLLLLTAYAALSAVYLFVSPSTEICSLDFRLEFPGAKEGELPNGTDFTPNEIIAPPVLKPVYESSGLAALVTMNEFAGSIFLTESSDALARLEREYEGHLANKNLSVVERQRLEDEFESRKQAIGKAGFSLSFQQHPKLTRLPRPVVEKALRGILAEWARVAEKERGVYRYDIPLLPPSAFGDESDKTDLLIATDNLRRRSITLRDGITALLDVPGAAAIRVGSPPVSLAELKTSLEIELASELDFLFNHSLTTHSGTSGLRTGYIATRVFRVQTELESESARLRALSESVGLYSQRWPSNEGNIRTLVPDTQGTDVTPQLSESFLDRLIQITADQAGRDYRQAVADEYRKVAERIISKRAELEFYRNLQSRNTAAAKTARPEDLEKEFDRVTRSLRTLAEQAQGLADFLGAHANGPAALYTVTSPMKTKRAATTSPSTIALGGLLLIAVAFPALCAVALLHARTRRESHVEF